MVKLALVLVCAILSSAVMADESPTFQRWEAIKTITRPLGTSTFGGKGALRSTAEGFANAFISDRREEINTECSYLSLTITTLNIGESPFIDNIRIFCYRRPLAEQLTLKKAQACDQQLTNKNIKADELLQFFDAFDCEKTIARAASIMRFVKNVDRTATTDSVNWTTLE